MDRVRNLVLQIVLLAVKRGASRIHIEPDDGGYRVRGRIGHDLVELGQGIDPSIELLVLKVKEMTDLDVSEHRLPQDGVLRIVNGDQRVTAFVSVSPGRSGPRLLFEIAQPFRAPLELGAFGLEPGHLERLRRAIRWPGVVLAAGPTHSGRHSLLYAAMTELAREPRTLGTVEDPVRFALPGVHQIGVEDDLGLGFGGALRAHQRQDTDVISVGDVRDFETAEQIAQAAVRGRTVLGAIHTSDAPSTITRLINMGVDAWLVAETVTLVQAQRLLRKLCAACKREREPGVFEPEGCDACAHTGHDGVVVVTEQLVVDRGIAAAIQAGATDLARLAVERGMVTLRQQAMARRDAGLVSTAEVVARTPPDVAGSA